MNAISRASFLTLLGAGALATLTPGRPLAQAAAPQGGPPEALLKGILQATKDGDYEGFLARADGEVRAGISKQMFEGVSGQVGPRLQKGYKTTYLTRLRQGGQTIHLWKLEFADGKDEALVRLTMNRDDPSRYAGILLQ